MTLPLPGALADFSKIAQTAIQALSAIQEAVSNPQAVVQANITKAVTVVATEVGQPFQDAPSMVDSSNSSFLSAITDPKSLDLGLQQAAAGALFGTNLTAGVAVDGFGEANVSLSDVLPSQQLYQLTQSLSISSLFADPLQAYTHIGANAVDIRNLCQEASSVVAKIQSDIANLLNVQLGIDYTQIAAMGPEFFAAAISKITLAIGKQNLLCAQLQVRGRYDPTATADLCNTLDELTNILLFANTKIAQFDILRADIINGMTRLRQIGRDLLAILSGTANFIPNYVKSTSIGKLFQAMQFKVCAQASVNLAGISDGLKAFTKISADDHSKVSAMNAMAAQIQSIKAFICGLQPSVDVVDPSGPYAGLKTGYDVFTAAIHAADPTALFQAIEAQIASFTALLNTGVIKENIAALTAGAATIGATLAGLAASMTALTTASVDFKTVFTTATNSDPDRTVGALNLYDRIGADNARSTSLLNAGDTTAVAIAESTTLGQLAASVATAITGLEDGNEKDQLSLLYEQVQAKHRSIVLAMDFTRREDVRTFLTPDAQEQNRQLVNKIVKTYSGIPQTEFDPVLTV